MRLSIVYTGKPVRLSAYLAAHKAPVDMPCGGAGRCLKCKVKVMGSLSPMDERERALLTPEEQAAHMRYACMTWVTGAATVELPDQKEDRILTNGTMAAFSLQPWASGYGVSVDIGTTTLAAYLYKLEEGKLLATASEKNPQHVYGADVISRLKQSLDGESKALATLIQEGIAQLLQQLCTDGGIPPEDITALVLTGNTAMLYLLSEQSPVSITAAPFTLDRAFGETVSAQSLGLPLAAQVYLPRCMSAYVGADITTATLAAGLYGKDGVCAGQPRLLVDIGTNGEMVLASNGELLCCSTAAGPAFEGAGIQCGMTAKAGAIHSVKWENGEIRCEVIGEGTPLGICGSGIVDAVAVMVTLGIVDDTGLILEDDHPFVQYITEIDGQPAFLLPGTAIAVTQKDIRAVQLAKSAICAGIQVLLAQAKLLPEDIGTLLIAGGFGSYIHMPSALRIGLFPRGFQGQTIGNAAGAGASMVLLSKESRAQSERLAGMTQTLELSTDPRFMDAYIEGMLFH